MHAGSPGEIILMTQRAEGRWHAPGWFLVRWQLWSFLQRSSRPTSGTRTNGGFSSSSSTAGFDSGPGAGALASAGAGLGSPSAVSCGGSEPVEKSRSVGTERDGCEREASSASDMEVPRALPPRRPPRPSESKTSWSPG
jgi:hypothetical protein